GIPRQLELRAPQDREPCNAPVLVRKPVEILVIADRRQRPNRALGEPHRPEPLGPPESAAADVHEIPRGGPGAPRGRRGVPGRGAVRVWNHSLKCPSAPITRYA